MKNSRARWLGLCGGLLVLLLGVAIAAAQGTYSNTNRNSYGSDNYRGTYSSKNTNTGVDKDREQQVLSRMHEVNQEEISMADLAIQKGHSRAVKSFGRRLKMDHRANDRQVTSIAKREGIDLGQPNPPSHQDLDSAQGRDFDRQFARMMADDHGKVAQELTQARKDFRSGRMRTLINRTIPVVKRHQRMAQSLASRA